MPFGLLEHLPPFITHYFLKARRGSLKTMEIQFRVKWRKAGRSKTKRHIYVSLPNVERKIQGEGNKIRGTSDPNQQSQGLSKTASSTPAPIIFPFPSPWSRLPTAHRHVTCGECEPGRAGRDGSLCSSILCQGQHAGGAAGVALPPKPHCRQSTGS